MENAFAPEIGTPSTLRAYRWLSGLLVFMVLYFVPVMHATEICRSQAPDGSVTFADCDEERVDQQTRLSIDDLQPNSYRSVETAEPGRGVSASTEQTVPDAHENGSTPAAEPEPGSISIQQQGPLPALDSPALQHLLNSSLRRDVARVEEIQKRYDARCEAARERVLAPERALIVQDCLKSNFYRTTQRCIDFAANHGAATVQRGPLYYELPECGDAYQLGLRHQKKRGRNTANRTR